MIDAKVCPDNFTTGGLNSSRHSEGQTAREERARSARYLLSPRGTYLMFVWNFQLMSGVNGSLKQRARNS